MPGNVATATIVNVMPQSLCLNFEEIREYALLQTTYHDGTRQASQLSSTSRKSFRLSRRLSVSLLNTLKTHYDSVTGTLGAFVFYNPFEGSPVGSNYDPAGNNVTGRYTVVYVNDWTQATDLGRSVVSGIILREVG